MIIAGFDPRDPYSLFEATCDKNFDGLGHKVGKIHFYSHKLAVLYTDDSKHKISEQTRDFACLVYSSLIPRSAVPPTAITFGHAYFQLKRAIEKYSNPMSTLLDLVHSFERMPVMSASIRKEIPKLKAMLYLMIDINSSSVEDQEEMAKTAVVKKYFNLEAGVYKLKAVEFSPELIDSFIPFLADAFLLSNDNPMFPDSERKYIHVFLSDAGKLLEHKIKKSIKEWIIEKKVLESKFYTKNPLEIDASEEVDGTWFDSDEAQAIIKETSTFNATHKEVKWGEGTLCRDLIRFAEWRMGRTFRDWWDSYEIKDGKTKPKVKEESSDDEETDLPKIKFRSKHGELSVDQEILIEKTLKEKPKMLESFLDLLMTDDLSPLLEDTDGDAYFNTFGKQLREYAFLKLAEDQKKRPSSLQLEKIDFKPKTAEHTILYRR